MLFLGCVGVLTDILAADGNVKENLDCDLGPLLHLLPGVDTGSGQGRSHNGEEQHGRQDSPLQVGK